MSLRDEIRTWVLIQGKSQRAAARHFDVSRNTVAKLLQEEPAHKRSSALAREPGAPYGALDTPLTEEGERQATLLADAFKDLPVQCIFASNLIRLRQTADILGEALSLPVHVREALQERLGTERQQEAGFRLFTALEEIAHLCGEQTIVVVSHGAILRGLLKNLGFAHPPELPPGSIAHTGYVVLETNGAHWSIAETRGVAKAQ